MRESPVLKACKDWLQFQKNQEKLWFTRLNSGKLIVKNKDGSNRMVQLCEKGTADLMVVQQTTWIDHLWEERKKPRIIFVETKSTNGKLSLAQEAFRDMVIAQGAEYLLVKDVDEMIRVLE